MDHEDWSRLFVLQVLMTCSEPEEEPGTGATAPTATEQASDLGQLSTIQEEESQERTHQPQFYLFLTVVKPPTVKCKEPRARL